MAVITVLYFLGFLPMGWFFFHNRANHAWLSTLFWPYVGAFLLIVALVSRPDLRAKVGVGSTPGELPAAPAQDGATFIQRPKYGVIESAERDVD